MSCQILCLRALFIRCGAGSWDMKVSYNSEKVGRGTKWLPDFAVKRSFQSNIIKKVKKRERRKISRGYLSY